MAYSAVYSRWNSYNHESCHQKHTFESSNMTPCFFLDSAETPCECTYPSRLRIETLPLQLASQSPCKRQSSFTFTQYIWQSPAQKRLKITISPARRRIPKAPIQSLHRREIHS